MLHLQLTPFGPLHGAASERHRSAASGLADALGDGRRLARAVPRPRPEEAAQPVALGPRHDVDVEVGDALADDVVVGDERALGAQRHRHGRGQQLDALEERPDVGELGQRHDVLGRHDQHVAGEQRRAVEEGDGDVVAVDDSAGASPATMAQNTQPGSTPATVRLLSHRGERYCSAPKERPARFLAVIHHRAADLRYNRAPLGTALVRPLPLFPDKEWQ